MLETLRWVSSFFKWILLITVGLLIAHYTSLYETTVNSSRLKLRKKYE